MKREPSGRQRLVDPTARDRPFKFHYYLSVNTRTFACFKSCSFSSLIFTQRWLLPLRGEARRGGSRTAMAAVECRFSELTDLELCLCGSCGISRNYIDIHGRNCYWWTNCLCPAALHCSKYFKWIHITGASVCTTHNRIGISGRKKFWRGWSNYFGRKATQTLSQIE